MIAKPCTDATSNDDNSGCIEHISQSGQGESTPPNRNIKNPSNAEAFPEFFLSKSRASVVELGNITPRKSIKTNSDTSTGHTEVEKNKAAATNKLIIPNPIEPTRNASVASWNNETVRLPSIMAIALAPKHRLYASGDMLKCS